MQEIMKNQNDEFSHDFLFTNFNENDKYSPIQRR